MQEESIWPNVTKSLGKSLVRSVWMLKKNEMAIRSQDGLRFFKHDEKQNDWKLVSNCDTRFSDKNKFDQERHKLKFFSQQDKTFVSFLTFNNGYVFLELDKSTFKLKQVAVDKRFVRKYSTLDMGYFYGVENPLGIFSLDKKIGAAFHYINLGSPKIPIIKHQKTSQLLNREFNWHQSDGNFFTVDVNENGRTNIVLVQSSSIVVYELKAFDDYFKPFKLFELKAKIDQSSKIFFSRLTPAPMGTYLDILIIQSDGLYVHKWNSTETKYNLINYSRAFSKANNWTMKHTQSILFSDFDSTGFNKFVYSGPNGLKIEKLDFSHESNEWTWTCLLELNSSTVNIGLKYLVPIEIVPLSKSPSKMPVLIANDILNKKCVIIAIEQQLKDNKNNNLDDDDDGGGGGDGDDDRKAEKQKLIKSKKKVQNVFPDFIQEEINAQKKIIYLRNVLDIKSIVNSCINPTNAQVQLKLPLISLPVFDEPLSLNYTSANISTGINSAYAQGWSFSQEFIYAELKSNKALHKFYLISSNGSVVLNLEDNHSNNNELYFSIENRNEKIKFYVNESKWMVENGNEKKVYGGGLSDLRPKGNGIEWKNIYLNSNTTTIRNNCASFKWYLTSVHTESNIAVFEYTNGPVVCLKEIKVNDSEISVNFDLNKDENLVQGFKYESKHHMQTIKFDYEIQNDSHTRLLRSINQMDNQSQVLKFNYSMMSNLMKIDQIILPNQVDCVTFEYEEASNKFLNSHYKYLNDAHLCVFEDKDSVCQLNVSNEYSVLNYVTKSKALLCLSIYTRDNFNFVVKLNAAQLVKNDCFTEYKVVTFGEHFVVWLFDPNRINDQVVCLCHLDSARKLTQDSNDPIDITHTLKIINDCKNVFFGNDFVTVNTRNHDIMVYEWMEYEWRAAFSEKLDSQVVKMSSNQDQTILVYDDHCLRFLFRDNNKCLKKWNMKKVIENVKSGLLTELDNFVQNFNLGKDKMEEIKQFMERNLLHFSKNLIVFNRVSIDQDTVNSHLLTLLTDDEYNVVKEQTLKNNSLDLNECIKEFEMKLSDKEIVKSQLYHFKAENEKYSVGFKYQSESFDLPVQKKTYKKTIELNEQKITTKIFDNHGYEVEQPDNEKCLIDELNDAFLLNIESLHVVLSNSRLIGTDRYFDMQSDGTWKMTLFENKNQNLKISDSFELVKEQDSTWQLYSNNKSIFNFCTDDMNKIQVAYPNYIAYMKDMSVYILPFEKQNSIGTEYVLTRADYVMPGGNQLGFGIKEPESCRVKFFTISSNSFARIKCRTLNLDGQCYTKMYQFDDSRSTIQNGMIFYSKFKSIPAGNESKFGHVECDFDNGISYFNADGKLVKIEQENEQIEKKSMSNQLDNLDNSSKQTVLFAKDGRTEVANFYNLDVDRDQADYFGFERYEQVKNWIYDKSCCVENKWPLTGSTFLRLVKSNNKRQIEKIFKPNQKTYYECSCWVRVSKFYSLNEKFDDFKLTIVENNQIIVSKVTSIYQDWLYLTIQVNLSQFDSIVSVKCQLEANSNESIDVDHIKWMEFNGRVQISAYDHSCSWLISQIDETNIIKRIIYNESSEPLVLIDSNNQLLQSSFFYNWNSTQVQIDANSSVFAANFSDYDLKNNWFFDKPFDWTRSGNLVCHIDNNKQSTIKLVSEIISKSSIAIYFRVQLGTLSQLTLGLNSHQVELKADKILVNEQTVGNCGSGYFLLIAIDGRVIVWKERELVVDQNFDLAKSPTGVTFTTCGMVKLSDVLVVNEPVLKVNHMNSFGLVCQSIQLENDSTVIIKENLYDELMRDSIETKPTRILIQNNEPSLAYRQDFVTNKLFDSESSVWQTKKLQGLITKLNPLDEGFSYQRKIYSKDPLNYVESVEFAEQLLSHKTIPKYSPNKSFEYFVSLFPIQDGFVCQTSIELNGNRTIKVYNKDNNMVALFQHTNNFKDTLTTYEFDNNQNLAKILPPLYHDEVFTLDHIGTTHEQLNQLWNSDEKYSKLQQQMASFFVYDENTNCLIETRTPERGLEKYVYNKLGLLRFNLRFNSNNEPIIVEYSNYNQWGEVTNKGFSRNKAHFDIEWLKSVANSMDTTLDESVSLQTSISNVSIKPGLNGKIIENMVKNSSNRFECNDRTCVSAMDKIVEKSSLLKRPDGSSSYLRMEREYVGTQLQSITYPFSYNDKIMKLNYKYNAQGLASSISIDEKKLIEFDYTSNGNLSNETIFTNLEKENFKRSYEYNSSGMLTTQDDCFLQESLSYSKYGYECEKDFYDTSISRTKFVPKWHDKCDVRSMTINQDILREQLDNLNEMEASYLLNLLVHHGYLDHDFRVIKNLSLSDALVKLPLKFDEYSINKLICLLNEHFPLTSFGHQYSYGANSELVNSKYFLGDGNAVPISSKSFLKEKKISIEQSKQIWKALVESEYIVPDDNNGQCKYGKVNTLEWIDQESLRHLLKTSGYPSSLLKKLIYLIQDGVEMRTNIPMDQFAKTFQQWLQPSDCYTKTECDIHLELGGKLWQLLSSNNYIYNSEETLCALFKPKFKSVVQKYGLMPFVPEIIQVLNLCASEQIGNSSCDVRSCDTDPNGNHKLFYVGTDRLQFNYTKNSNQVSSIESQGRTHQFEYDTLGNVTKAEHKQIEKIVYDEISNRAVKFMLKDGTQIDLAYDSMNERAYKCVMDNESKKMREILYFRDNSGRCLVEKEIIYNKQQQIENEFFTAYVYGPKGLSGFVRNDEFYNVITDHEQSVRLVVKNMQVVAAYDYMPYGNVIRSFGNGEMSNIRYRFTGQEWDEELGLYNYHARFYDPTIGRFYQVDSKEQYASPYKYAGNSPVCMYDPDGNLAFVVVLGFVLVGAYLGGAASMDSWNPLEWEWDNVNLYLGLSFGGLTGLFLPFGFCAAAATIAAFFGISLAVGIAITGAIGIIGAYFGMSSSMGSFNPCDWKWKKPALYNAAFQGFSSAVQFPNLISNFASVLGQFNLLGKSILIFSSIFSGVSMAYLTMASINNSYNPKNWQLNQRTIIGGINGFLSGFFLPTTVININRFYAKDFIDIKKNLISSWGKLGYVFLFGVFTLAAIMPFLFLYALKQGMQCEWSKIVSRPAFLETVLSGIIVGVSLPNLFFKAIPKTLKAYSEGIFKTLFSNLNKVIKNDQELVKEFTDEKTDALAQDMSNGIKGDENSPYQNSPDDIKQDVDNYLNESKDQMKENGTVKQPNELYRNIFAKLNPDMPIPDNLTAQDLQNSINENPNIDASTKENCTSLVNDIQASFDDISNRVMPIGGTGVYSVTRLKNGMTIVCHSSSKELWAVYDADGNRIPNDDQRLQNLSNDRKLNSQMSNGNIKYANEISNATDKRIFAKCCAEFRSAYIIMDRLGIPKDQVFSINAFEARDPNLNPVMRCVNCQITTNMVKDSFVFTDWINEDQNNQYPTRAENNLAYARTNDGTMLIYDPNDNNRIVRTFNTNGEVIFGPYNTNLDNYTIRTDCFRFSELMTAQTHINTIFVQEVRYDINVTDFYSNNWTRFQNKNRDSPYTLGNLFKKNKSKKD